MLKTSRIPLFLQLPVFLLVLTFFTSPVDADFFDVETTQVGGFFETGTPDNEATFQNYFVGLSTPAGSSTPLPERRSFFIFDIPEFGPDETLVDATFSIYLPTEFSIPANFTGGIEVFDITSSDFTAEEILDPVGFGLAPEEIFPTFGFGDFYGDAVFEEADPPTGPFPLEIVIPLSPTAIDDIAMSAGGKFVITGRMASYDPAPDASAEIIFSLSDLVVGGSETSLPSPFLSLTTIPEPNAVALLAVISCIGFSRIRRRRIRRS